MTQHPVERLTAAVDGELGHDARDKVYSHLVGCDACRAEIEADRELKARLSGLYRPEPPMDLTQRLLGISSFATEAREEVRAVVTPVTLSPAKSAFPSSRSSRSSPSSPNGPSSPNSPTRPAAGPGRTRSRRRTAVVSAAGSAAAVASLLGTAFVIGEPSQEQPPVLQPPVSSFSVDHASTTNTNPFGDSATLVGLSGR